MKLRFLLLLFAALLSATTDAAPYQIRLSGGYDITPTGSAQPTSYLLQSQISTLTRFIRFQSAFTFLYGTEYMEGEAGFGLSLYLLAPFVGTRAPVQPYLSGGGSAGFGTLAGAQRQDIGPYYGAGVDLKMAQKSGMNIAVEQHMASAKSIRFLIGYYWVQGELK